MNKPRRPPRRRVDGVLLLDKPAGCSSNGALQRAREMFNAASGGHTGALDPFATGLLPLCFGAASRFAGRMLDADKSYLATVRFGVVTDSGDIDGKVLAQAPCDFDAPRLNAVLAGFRGRIEQVPPMFSALKRNGRPLYELARAGVEVERAARVVNVSVLELLSLDLDADGGPQCVLRVDCSKGLYVRVLAADIGAALGCGAHLTALRRSRVGPFDVAAAIDLDALQALSLPARDALLLAAESLLAGLPVLQLDADQATALQRGQVVTTQAPPPPGEQRVHGPQGFIGLGEVDAAGRLRAKRLLPDERSCQPAAMCI